MNFADRIMFLMNLTSTTNRQLADAVKVDLSLISLIRTGRREPSKNNTYVREIAAYFAARCDSNYQRVALSEAMEKKHFRLDMDEVLLSSLIFDWLTDNRDRVGSLLSTFERSTIEEPQTHIELNLNEVPPKVSSGSFAFYGNDGKRSAVNAFITHLLKLEERGTILLFTDESAEWLFDEPVYLPKLVDKMKLLLQKGYKIKRISGPLTSADQAFYSLSKWLPFYMTGQVESYFYPRLRDNLLRRTLIVLPNVGAVVSTTCEGKKESNATLYVLDRHLADSFAGEFNDYLAKCRPMMTTYTREKNLNEILHCFSQFESDSGERIQQSSSLSSITLPQSLMRTAAGREEKSETDAIVASLTESCKKFKQGLEEYKVVDIQRVATADEVRAGKVPISTAYILDNRRIYYTAETYAEHLKSILYYLNNFPNYNAVLLPREKGVHALMVKESRRALLLRPEPSLIVFEVSQPNIADACREYLLRLAESNLSPELQRKETASYLKQLIRELEKN